jgi:translation elongation factor EF-Ts
MIAWHDAQHIRRHGYYPPKQVRAQCIFRDENPELIDTTNREGLVANAAFFDLVQAVSAAVDEVNAQRWRERETRERQRAKSGGPVEEALKKISGTLDKDLLIPHAVKLEVGDLLNKVRLEQHTTHEDGGRVGKCIAISHPWASQQRRLARTEASGSI